MPFHKNHLVSKFVTIYLFICIYYFLHLYLHYISFLPSLAGIVRYLYFDDIYIYISIKYISYRDIYIYIYIYIEMNLMLQKTMAAALGSVHAIDIATRSLDETLPESWLLLMIPG